MLVDDGQESSDEIENDISFVYSGYAPISIRLVQCVAQKGGVLSNPAGGKDKGAENGDRPAKSATGKVQAHPIVGWKGFDDLLASIPGETVDIIPKLAGDVDPTALPTVTSLCEFCNRTDVKSDSNSFGSRAST